MRIPTRAISFTIAGVFLMVIFWPVLHPPNTTLHHAVLQRQFKSLKAPSDAKLLYVDEKPKLGRVFLGAYYLSDISFEQLQHFYVPLFQHNGWHLLQETPLAVSGRDTGGRQITLCKGDYEANIEYAGERQNAGWSYSVSMSWSPENKCRSAQ